MTHADACKALFKRWIEQWPGASSNVPYALEDRALVQPTPATFAIVEISDLDGDQATMGPPGRRQYERLGFFDVRLYGPRGQGRGALDVLTGYVRELFESTRIGITPTEHGITTYTTSSRAQRSDREYPDLRCVLVRTPFMFRERR